MKDKERHILISIKSILELSYNNIYYKEMNFLLKRTENSSLIIPIVDQLKRKNFGKVIDIIDDFLFNKTNNNYLYNKFDIKIFDFDLLENVNIDKIKDVLGINELKLNTRITYNKKDSLYYRHWENNGRFQVLITKSLVEKIKNDQTSLLRIKKNIEISEKGYFTNFNIIAHDELFADEILENDYDDTDYDDHRSYDKYNGAYGFDDNTIDSAFDGDPENYWNID